MRAFKRKDNLFSLCGPNCGLCPMYIRKECGGCFSDSPCYPTCPIAPCSLRHGNVEYCYQCSEYPCKRYDDIDQYDSLISHRNQKKDLSKAKKIGIESYLDEQREKAIILDRLLKEYDGGHKDVFFCLAVNMLPLKELNRLMENENAASEAADLTIKEKEAYIESKLYECAKGLGIELRLRPWRT